MSKMKDFYWDEICEMQVLCETFPRPQTPLEKAKAQLGERWVLHPKYVPLARHSLAIGDQWVKHSVLAAVRANAVAMGRL